MSETFDTYDTYEVIGDDGCCCCDPSEDIVDDWTEELPAASYDEPVVVDDVAPAVDLEPHFAAPVDVAPVEVELPVEAPTAVSAAHGPGASAAVAPTIALVGGTDPYGDVTITDGAGHAVDTAALLQSTATIGGTDPYGGMTIVDAGGSPAELTTSMVIGGPNAFSEASLGYTADMARFEQLTYGQKMADMFGGTPELWEGTPKISLYPTAGESVNDTMVRSVVTTQAASLLSRIQDAFRNGH